MPFHTGHYLNEVARELNRKLLCKYDETQGSKGLRQCQVKIIHLPNDDTQNNPLCTLPSTKWMKRFGIST